MSPLTTRLSASARTLKERLSHHRLIQVFIAVAVVHCLLQTFLQGEALAVSRGGAHLLHEIREAPIRGLAVVRPNDVLVTPTSTPSTSTSTSFASSSSAQAAATTPTLVAAPTTRYSDSASSTSSSSRSTSSSRTATSTSSTRPAASTGIDEDESLGDTDDAMAKVESRAKRSLRRATNVVDLDAMSAFREKRDDDKKDDEKYKPVNNTASMFLVPEVTDVQGRVLKVSSQCAASLQWPTVYVERMQTMSTAFIFFQLWVLVISVLAVVYESVPHLAAVMIAHFLGLVYSIFQVTQTRHFHRLFHQQIIKDACNSDIIPGFWEEVFQFQVSIAVLEAVGLVAIAFLAWKLMSVLEWRTFKKLGADRRIARAHAVSLIFQIFLQLLAFFIIAFQGLWLHELCTYQFPDAWYSIYAELTMGYRVFLGILTGLVVPWLFIGYVAVRREKRGLMVGFLVANVLLIGHSIFLTTQKIYMDTMSSFKFLTFVGSVATLVAACTLVFGLICLRNFNRVAMKGISVEWVASFPNVDDKYDPEKGFFEIDLASPAVFSVQIPRPQPSLAPSTSFKPSTSYLNNLPPPRRAASKSSRYLVSSEDVAPPTNATRRPPPKTSGTILERQGSGSRKPAPAHLTIHPAVPLAIAVNDSSPHSSYQAPTTALRSPETLHLRSSWDASTVVSSTQGSRTGASNGTFGRGANEGDMRVVSRWSISTRTSESEGAQTPAARMGSKGMRGSRQMPQ